ncbi:MAG: tryptophan--tRNA ligase [Candidatus Jacksonbacteria bacterium]|nr:tryptophan--tRNA ligase [Candidatus Jacksonbacteria bacterium]
MPYKKTILSGIQPSGKLHIGNYVGAIKNWATLQNSGDYTCYFMIADLHACILNPEPKILRRNVHELAIDLVAGGLDPKKSTIFIQSHLPEHAYLSWVFSTLTAISELERMHQFKEKSAQKEVAINAGLFTYPILQAADILIYKGDLVPAGEDQKQHVELTRDIAHRFNNVYGKTFPETKILLTKTPRVMSIADPTSKMSKSKGEKNYIALSDSPTIIKKKIFSAVTDTSPDGTMSAGIKNLFTLLEAFTQDEKTYRELLNAYNAKTLQYRELKETLSEEIITVLAPIQEKRKELETHPETVAEILSEGTNKARRVAQETLKEVKEKVGLL